MGNWIHKPGSSYFLVPNMKSKLTDAMWKLWKVSKSNIKKDGFRVVRAGPRYIVTYIGHPDDLDELCEKWTKEILYIM